MVYFVREINCLFTTQFTFFFSAVQEKYRKSSVTKQIKNKFSSSLINKKKSDQIGNNHPGVDVVGSNNSMSKFRSHSHGALPSLDEFTKSVVPEEVDDLEDDINGIWSASQLAAKEKNIITQNSTTPKSSQVS